MQLPLSLDEVRRSYTRWAPWYDATHIPLPFRRRARRALGLQRGDHVLEIACGTGLNLPALARAVGPEGRVVGIDLTPAMVERAAARLRRRRLEGVRAEVGDAARLPFEDASFDGVLCTYGLTVIPAYEAAIREARRVLRPTGRFAVLEVAPPERERAERWGRRTPRLSHVCAVDLSHDVVGALRRHFSVVEVRRIGAFWFLARARP